MTRSSAYLGDGLYAEFDGYMLKLMANSAISPTDTVYLEPAVYAELLRFVSRWAEAQEANNDN